MFCAKKNPWRRLLGPAMDVSVQKKLRYNAKKSSQLFGREDFIVSNTSSCRVPSFVAFAENVIK
jgi:hypothetical protein